MFKNKAFLIGLGSGLIVAAVLLQLMWKVDEMENKPSALTGWTAEQVKAEADKLKLQVYSAQQVDELKAKAAEEEKARASKAGAAATPAPVSTPAPTPASSAAGQSPAPAASAKPMTRSVYIPDKTDATTIANLLVQAQILSEPTQLLALLEEQKLNTRIRYGLYTFAEAPDLNEVLKTITLP